MQVQNMSRSCLLYLTNFSVYKARDQRILGIFLHNFVSDLSRIATGRTGNNDTQIIELIQHLNCGKLSRFQHIGLGHLDNRKFCCS